MSSNFQPLFASSASLTLTLTSLANGSARQSTVVDNTTNRYDAVYIFPQVKLGTSPTANTLITFYLIRDDGSAHRTDNAGSADAAITLKNAVVIGTLSTGGSPSTGDILYGDFKVVDPGPKWAVAVSNGSGAALDGTAGGTVYYVGEYHQAS